MRKGLLRTVTAIADPATSQLQQNLKDAIEVLAGDDDILRVPTLVLSVSGPIAAGRSVAVYSGKPGATLTLPLAAAQASIVSAMVLVANRSSGPITVAAAPTDTIGGTLSVVLPAQGSMLFTSDGVHEWFAIVVTGGAWTDFTADLGVSNRSGHFDITGLAGLVPGKNVDIVQTAQPIASKGGARDEFEFDDIQLTGYVVDATTIRAYWNAKGTVVGTYAFAYQVGA